MGTADGVKMHFLDVRCRCGAEYERAESDSALRSDEPREIRCGICEAPLEIAHKPTLVAYRLVIPPDAPPVASRHGATRRAQPDVRAFGT